jgi:hypothetical protein
MDVACFHLYNLQRLPGSKTATKISILQKHSVSITAISDYLLIAIAARSLIDCISLTQASLYPQAASKNFGYHMI